MTLWHLLNATTCADRLQSVDDEILSCRSNSNRLLANLLHVPPDDVAPVVQVTFHLAVDLMYNFLWTSYCGFAVRQEVTEFCYVALLC